MKPHQKHIEGRLSLEQLKKLTLPRLQKLRRAANKAAGVTKAPFLDDGDADLLSPEQERKAKKATLPYRQYLRDIHLAIESLKGITK
jgi:hypothetical protein